MDLSSKHAPISPPISSRPSPPPKEFHDHEHEQDEGEYNNTSSDREERQDDARKSAITATSSTPQNSIILPSLASASKSLLSRSHANHMDHHEIDHETSMDSTSFHSGDYQFVFRSRRIESCKYEPYKVVLFIASGAGYHEEEEETNGIDHTAVEDVRLSPTAVSQCKAVSSVLRKAKQAEPDIMYCSSMYRALSTMQLVCPDWCAAKAKQAEPDIMYCSSMYRALSTMQLVCPDWYDDVHCIVGLDQLRPSLGIFACDKRSNLDELKCAFKRVSFKPRHRRDENEDTLWKAERAETEQEFAQRLHQFLIKYLVPNTELLRTQYGTIQESKLENIGWRSPSANNHNNNTSLLSLSLSPQQTAATAADKSYVPFRKRVVVVSHCDVLRYLMRNLVQDTSEELRKEWKHCDVRKVFVYTKQQLGMADIPCYALSNGHYYSPNNSLNFHAPSSRSRRLYKQPHSQRYPLHHSQSQRSVTPNPPTSLHRKAKSSLFVLGNAEKKDGIATTSSGDILMTNKPFESHTFTLTTMSAAICKYRQSHPYQRRDRPPHSIVPVGFSKSADIFACGDDDDFDGGKKEKTQRAAHTDSSQSTSEQMESSRFEEDEDDDDDEDDEEIRVVNPGELMAEMVNDENENHQNQTRRTVLKTSSSANDADVGVEYKNESNRERTDRLKVGIVSNSKTADQHVIIITPPSQRRGSNKHSNSASNK
eukprot:CAMPEP_0197076018 /NCGR_PEP_ID=MMETSP1384-20130603/211899_1 /TAXON_ID=29189 /ORGANISM="Ammonia sp." /LENGTH=707 /DNA_ID=CAMNT_0042514867 /DNA_START=113 /DNA_END=2237 /DNA_ORIENTATION=+